MCNQDKVEIILSSAKLSDLEKLKQIWQYTCTEEDKEKLKAMHYGLYYTILAMVHK